MQAAVPYLKIGAGVWAVTRAIRWGVPHLIPQNPEEGSLGYRIKYVYDWFLNSQHEQVVQTRLCFAIAYDFLPITIPLAYYKSSHAQYNFLEFIVAFDFMLSVCWFTAFGFTRCIATQQTFPNAAALARRIQPWLEPTGFQGCFNN
jgi:hypothetical protein